ncbi:GNAT family N-acetyltransferase [Vibrio salinus]|uniref:GNAT family N-acetyltransferase n=1 Tax=Vibrio salinus TaxID=2899784 RepID=UPI001E59F44C|nr:GNAT family N-acetyltransferase [Vibrio salinus]MCE0493278.1 GNAT family N-acetyltransferase [Vibrio salinus]
MSSSRERKGIQCEWFENPDKQWLEKVWTDLENRADSNFFLSWLWIRSWLDCFVDHFFLLEAKRLGKTVGLGIVVTKSGFLGTKGIRVKHYLHRTGISEEDQIWIEYNDFLISDQNTAEIRHAMCASVYYWLGPSDAFIAGASKPEKFSDLNALGLFERKIWETTNYFLELNWLRENNQSVLESISRNSRYQITRSLREYENIGEISVKQMQTRAEALELLELAKPYHLARWGNGQSGSGLANPKFISFHEMLISRGLSSGCIELNHIKAGDETIGIVYNFRYKKVLYFYFCSMNYSHESSHFKPGLVSHYLLIKKALDDGIDIYDFMGGEARYKSTFANKQGKLVVCQYEHPRCLLSVENFAREVKHKLSESPLGETLKEKIHSKMGL